TSSNVSAKAPRAAAARRIIVGVKATQLSGIGGGSTTRPGRSVSRSTSCQIRANTFRPAPTVGGKDQEQQADALYHHQTHTEQRAVVRDDVGQEEERERRVDSREHAHRGGAGDVPAVSYKHDRGDQDPEVEKQRIDVGKKEQPLPSAYGKKPGGVQERDRHECSGKSHPERTHVVGDRLRFASPCEVGSSATSDKGLSRLPNAGHGPKLGRASCRERVDCYGTDEPGAIGYGQW